MIEPESYYPIIPMVLVNGSEGIGTGFSTFIPQYNPKDIIKNIYNLMNEKDITEMKPWNINYKGKYRKVDDNTWELCGNYDIVDSNNIIINELPLGTWTWAYKEYIESIQYDNDSKKNIIIGFTNNNTDEKVHFVVTFPDGKMNLYLKNDTIEQKLKLTRRIKTSNMHLFNENGVIQKFASPEDILSYWYNLRLEKYTFRKEYLIGKYTNELDLLKYKALFIKYVLEEKIIVFKQKRETIIKKL